MASERRRETRTGGRAATSGVILGDCALAVGKPSKPLPPGWRWTPLTDVARLETGHTPSRRCPDYWGGDIPWIGTKDATANHGRTIYRTSQYTNELGIANSSARVLPAKTVCLSRTASIGYVVVMGKPMATSQDFVNWVCSDLLDYRYLKYVLLAERDSFLRFASGTTHQTIYFPEVKAFHAALPNVDEQRRIADVLSALDDRAELLSEQSQTLEAIARTLFKSWFVDFDPVRAKAEGREPVGMDPGTAAQFPKAFQQSELGPIPEGWRVSDLGAVCRNIRQQAKPNELTAETAYIGLEHMPRRSIALSEAGTAEGLVSGKFWFRTNDVLFGKLRPYFHKVGVAGCDGVCSTASDRPTPPRRPPPRHPPWPAPRPPCPRRQGTTVTGR
jgi:type I restriction enzyme S subunit